MKLVAITIISLLSTAVMSARELPISWEISLKSPGNPAEVVTLSESGDGILKAPEGAPVQVRQQIKEENGIMSVSLTVTARALIYYNIGQTIHTGFDSNDCMLYMPGFWYRKNLRSPAEAPSFHTSDSWTVREDRLSTPLTGIYNESTGGYVTVLRTDCLNKEALACHSYGEVILSGETSLGYTGFDNASGKAALVCGFPYKETPASYKRKLTLAPAVCAFDKLEAGESRTITWEIRSGEIGSWSDFVADVWEYSYEKFKPLPVEGVHSSAEAKDILSKYFEQSYVSDYCLKYYSGVGLRCADCQSNGIAEVGFIGRTLLNAYNAMEYAQPRGLEKMAADAESVFSSYLEHGFTPGGLLREDVRFGENNGGAKGKESGVYSIRRQAEGVCAVLDYLKSEKQAGRSHRQWESRMRTLLDRMLMLQNADGSFPRKFDDSLAVVDSSGGSTSSAVLPLAMAYSYFKDRKYLAAAEKAADYLETVLIAESDYFSSTLDANCEDKEASLYTATAMYYMSLVEKKAAKKQHYADLCLESAYFALSWYYLWDVPFAQGQMLGDVGFKSRGWGNVSVENNHIDVFIFEFADVLDFLAKTFDKPQFSDFTAVIRTSMLQLLPEQGSMFNIGKEGYCPEVVQHTCWDYGKNGKGFYNDIFAPGWTVASLWQMLSPGRAENYFN